MNKLNGKIIVLFCALTMFLAAGISSAQTAKKDLKVSMQERFAKLNDLKKSGKIGENPFGFAEAVKEEFSQDEEISKLIKAENTDRRLLYELIAEESETSVQEVGMGNAKRYFEKAPDSYYFKTKGGEWKQKKELLSKKD